MNRFLSCLAGSKAISAWIALTLVSLLAPGCRGPSTNSPSPGAGDAARYAATNSPFNATTSELRVGEMIMVSFSDLSIEHQLRPLELRIGDDGNVTLYHNITVQAAGKTATQLQEEIRSAYVPRLFKQLTVTVKGSTRVYFVGGEVRNPNKFEHLGLVTVLRAIDTAGGFTEYADKTEIELIRSTGERFLINGKKAVRSSKLDLEVLPNDRIYVPRRFY